MVNKTRSVGDRHVADTTAKQTDVVVSGAPEASWPPALPLRADQLPMPELIDLYMAYYVGKDQSRGQRLAWWASQLRDLPLAELSDDHVHGALEQLSKRPSRYFVGRDADGRSIFKARGKPIAPATVNRYAAALAAVVSWAIKRRIAPKGFTHPCGTVERRPEHNEKTRFLSSEERSRLLAACRGSKWPRLYALVLMAITTGARKGELLALRWQDLDLANALAYCGRTKNGDPKTLPLVPAVVEAVRPFQRHDGFVFAASPGSGRPYSFEFRWKAALRDAKLRDVRFHDLRHTCASVLAQNGATLLEIADVLGHRQLQVTKRYSHLTTGHKSALVNRVLGDIR